MDELLKNTKRLNPPDTLWQKVEMEMADGARKVNAPQFMEWLFTLFANRKPALSVAAVAAVALMLTIRLAPNSEVIIEPLQHDDTIEMNNFIDETLGSVFIYDSGFNSNSGGNADNSGLTLSEGLDNILWINGGDNA
ncbi:hypothetical protein MNBD_NITROSPINAE02-1276 [hydrothermal vent metagenome]|uniref:Uncharacterized protein n=1 Tax=hydrothermal vent metagenome TaxID=652676 RepID=A0A3B1BC95_9ZZZZ